MTDDVFQTNTANLSTLVYAAGDVFVSKLSTQGSQVTMKLRDGERPTAKELASALRASQLVSAAAVGDDAIVATFADEASARQVTTELLRFVVPATHQVESFEENQKLVFRRIAGGSGFSRLTVYNYASEAEEWRHFLGGEVTMVANVTGGQQHYLRKDPSVRVTDFSDPATAGLIFRVTSPGVSDVNVRRAISLALRRGPIAQMVTGDASRAMAMPEDWNQAVQLLAAAGYGPDKPLVISILVLAQASDFQRAGLVIEQQLALVHVDVDFLVANDAEFDKRLAEGSYDAMIFYGALDPRYWYWVVTGNGMTNYSNPEFDDAYLKRDAARGRAILERDLPLTPLYRLDQATATDACLCGLAPVTSSDYFWLAKIRPCAPGESG